MTPTLDSLEPALLWKHFRALSAIPRPSKSEAAVAAYVVETARSLGLPCRRDGTGNLVVTKPGTPGREAEPPAILQGHLDMVCEKNSSTAHDFTKDPIRLVPDGEWVKADGTTLGADNGIGVAAALAVLESKDVSHGPLECLFTIDEETGMTGAYGLTAGFLSGNRMLNLDTEEEGAVYVGCAGGMDTVARTKVALVAPSPGTRAYRVSFTGFRGGHSGVDIHEGRANAIKLLARFLFASGERLGLEVASIEGGSKRNAIPREAFATVFADPGREDELKGAVSRLEADLKAEYGPIEPNLTLGVERAAETPGKVFAAPDAARVVGYLHASPHGRLAMSPDIPDLVQTSTNLAIVATAGDEVTVSMSHRSSVESAKLDVGTQVRALSALAGFEAEQGEGYPGWKPDVSSPLLSQAKQVHARLFGAEPAVKAIHAGLECGIIGEKYPGLMTISFGPTIQNAHSPDEKVHVPSVGRFWTYLVAMLAEPPARATAKAA